MLFSRLVVLVWTIGLQEPTIALFDIQLNASVVREIQLQVVRDGALASEAGAAERLGVERAIKVGSFFATTQM